MQFPDINYQQLANDVSAAISELSRVAQTEVGFIKGVGLNIEASTAIKSTERMQVALANVIEKMSNFHSALGTYKRYLGHVES